MIKISKTIFVLMFSFFTIVFLATVGPAAAQSSAERTVTITYDPLGDPAHPETGPFVFSPYDLEIEKGASQVPINLVIVSDGFSFPDDLSKAFKIDPSDGNFKVLGVGPSNQKIMLIDFNREEMSYKYSVIIVNFETGREFVIDPRIQNGGGGTTD